MERRHRAGALHKNCLYTPMWVKESRTGSKAQRSDRVRIERHKLAEATWTADECYSTWTRSLRYASLPVLLCGRPPPVLHMLTNIGGLKSLFVQSIAGHKNDPRITQEISVFRGSFS